MPDDKKYTTSEKIEWFRSHVSEVRKDTLSTCCRDMLPLKAHTAALTALRESAAMSGESHEPLSCEGCTFFGRGLSNPCNQCCRGKKDFLGDSLRNAKKETE
ncbi:hypothetical protein SDC9_98947 [bioreactor metagenome]|uniref:Uncharacterized protein n=1 Tax=bioreactor metagenome TaxID=1076179 RepID=A0A645AIS6_9ZZZZ